MKILNCFYQLIAFLIIASMCISCTPKQMTKEVIKKDADGFSPTFSVPKVDATFYEDCIRKFKTRNPDSIITTDLIKFSITGISKSFETVIINIAGHKIANLSWNDPYRTLSWNKITNKGDKAVKGTYLMIVNKKILHKFLISQ